MQSISTTIGQAGIHVRYADHIDAIQATEWIDIQIKRSEVKHPSGSPMPNELADQFLGELQVAALDRALQIIQAEIRRLKNSGRGAR